MFASVLARLLEGHFCRKLNSVASRRCEPATASILEVGELLIIIIKFLALNHPTGVGDHARKIISKDYGGGIQIRELRHPRSAETHN